ncbi:hypothetical protein C8Q74DRAFT_1271332 [Fomes fomentarius]|nr:hypothetical protein C8Q74DRAFT_1271332 [Fomes fomentarius]
MSGPPCECYLPSPFAPTPASARRIHILPWSLSSVSSTRIWFGKQWTPCPSRVRSISSPPRDLFTLLSPTFSTRASETATEPTTSWSRPESSSGISSSSFSKRGGGLFSYSMARQRAAAHIELDLSARASSSEESYSSLLLDSAIAAQCDGHFCHCGGQGRSGWDRHTGGWDVCSSAGQRGARAVAFILSCHWYQLQGPAHCVS